MAKRIGPAKIKKYSLEFKPKAVHLSDQPEVLINDVAESLCIVLHALQVAQAGQGRRAGGVAARSRVRRQNASPSLVLGKPVHRYMPERVQASWAQCSESARLKPLGGPPWEPGSLEMPVAGRIGCCLRNETRRFENGINEISFAPAISQARFTYQG
jgi:hypothetical protein